MAAWITHLLITEVHEMEAFVSAFILVDTSCEVSGSLLKVIELLDPNIEES